MEKLTNEAIIINQKLVKEAGCTCCKYCINPSCDYESGYGEPGSCTLEGNERYGNLKSFPFQKHKECFSPDIWFLIGIDSDICALNDKSFNLDLASDIIGDIGMHNDKDYSEKIKSSKEKSKEFIKQMYKLAKERYGFN